MWPMLLLLIAAVGLDARPLCDAATDDNTTEAVLVASFGNSLMQRAHSVLSKSSQSFSASIDASPAFYADANAMPVQIPDSPLQSMVKSHPGLLLAATLLIVLCCFGGGILVLSWALDQYEASQQASGHIGRPWYMDDRMTMKVGGAALVMWLACGMVVFMNVVYFSISGGEVRSLTAIAAIYLCMQIVTTVGYGDITPSDPAGQVLVASFILLGVVLVGVVAAEMLKVLVRGGERAIIRAICHDEDAMDDDGVRRVMSTRSQGRGMLQEQLAKEMSSDDFKEQSRVYSEFLLSIAPFTLCLVIGTLFFRWYPGEDKSIWQAFYMSCVTLTSVGFGAVTPTTQGGKLFSSFWMLIGVGATAHMIICFGNWFLKRHREIQVGQLQLELLREMDEDGNNSVDKCEFLRFELIRTGLCQKEDIDKILHRFQRLDLDKSGSIDLEDLKQLRGLSENTGIQRRSTSEVFFDPDSPEQGGGPDRR